MTLTIGLVVHDCVRDQARSAFIHDQEQESRVLMSWLWLWRLYRSIAAKIWVVVTSIALECSPHQPNTSAVTYTLINTSHIFATPLLIALLLDSLYRKLRVSDLDILFSTYISYYV